MVYQNPAGQQLIWKCLLFLLDTSLSDGLKAGLFMHWPFLQITRLPHIKIPLKYEPKYSPLLNSPLPVLYESPAFRR